MSSHVVNKLPKCEEILNDRKTWGLSLNALKIKRDFEFRSNTSDKFHLHFIKMKSKYKQNLNYMYSEDVIIDNH